MYEKHGLMSKISNPLVLSYLRSHKGKSYTRQIEKAMWKKLGRDLPDDDCDTRGRNKNTDLRTSLPVKVLDPKLIDYLISQRTVFGISYRHTIESAILEQIVGESK